MIICILHVFFTCPLSLLYPISIGTWIPEVCWIFLRHEVSGSVGSNTWCPMLFHLTLRLADFGSACRSGPNEFHQDFVGSLTNLAPEALPSVPGERQSAQIYQGRPVDVWAAAITFYEVVAGVPPFRGSSFAKLLQAIQQGIDLEERNFFDPLDLSFPALGQMFAKEPEQRCTA